MLFKSLFYSIVFVMFSNAVFSESHRPQEFLQRIEGSKDEGEQIVQAFCANCHAVEPLIAIGAPRMGIESDWEARVQQGRKNLFKHTDEGFNAMPPRGGCFECSDKQLWLAIIAMLPKSNSHQFTQAHKDHKRTNKKK